MEGAGSWHCGASPPMGTVECVLQFALKLIQFLTIPWLQTGVSGFHSLKEPATAMEGGDLARLWKGVKTGRLSPRSAQGHHVHQVRHGSCATENAF